VTTFIALKRTSPIRIWNVSSGGCLLESRERFPVGAVGVLHVDLDGQPRREWFRVCRVHAVEGRRGTCLLGAEFLPLAPAGHDSLRRAASDLLGA
jgi:PilZ domain-containing protein